MNQLLPKILIFLTFFGNCGIVGILLTSLVSNSWITAKISYFTHTTNITTTVNEKNSKYGFVQFGLFTYEKTLNHGYGERHDKDINVISVIKDDDEVLGNYYLWLFTALGTGFSLFASSVAAVASVIATIKQKSGMALMITSNVVSGIGQIVALACWILQFVNYLQHNVLLKVDQDKWSSSGSSTFGYSFYCILIAFAIIILNITLLVSARRADSRYKRSLEGPIDEKEGNSIMLY